MELFGTIRQAVTPMNIRTKQVFAWPGLLFCLLCWVMPIHAQTDEHWPAGAKVAVSLSYDDALESQLDVALPALNRYGFKASFYLPIAYPGVKNRLQEWREVARQGHELGNHTLFHPCHPDQYWVSPEQDLERYTMNQIVREIRTANVFLEALDGWRARTFTPACFDLTINGTSYVPLIEDEFIAIKGLDNGMPPDSHVLWAPSEVDGEALIEFVRSHTKAGMVINILFHGIGSDYLAVPAEAHEDLLQFLARNRETYWVDTYRDIMSKDR